MLCENCKQREANVHLSKTVNGQTHELHLCDQCAKKTQEVNFVFHSGVSVPDFLQALFGFSAVPKTAGIQQEEACPRCGMTFSQITRAGKLGCNMCYEKFSRELQPLLRKIHGGGQHVGKVPKRRGSVLREKLELKKLKEKLRILILQEKFEEAVEVRDRIRELEQKAGGGTDAAQGDLA